MIHEHHQWLEDVNMSIVESYERDQEMARQPGRVQRTGHRVESRWEGVLAAWLPPQYEIGKRKYLLLETEDGPPATKETDLVVFHPHYPNELRKKESVLASGVAAAFSVRRTVDRDDIAEAYAEGITLRRGMEVRGGTLRQYLAPPVFFGLLGESHGWKASNSKPKENVKSITDQLDSESVKSPREGLDFLCIADLGTWARVTSVLTEKFLFGNPGVGSLLLALAGANSAVEALVVSGMRHKYEEQNLSPLTSFIGSLWAKLAINDPTLKPLADGFRITKTTEANGSFGIGPGPYKLAEVASAEAANSVRSGAWGPEWDYIY